LSINAVNNQFATQFNPLQRQGAASAFGVAQPQVVNPFAAANPLGQQANSFGSFGAAQGAQDAPLDPALLALLQGGAGKKEEKKDGGIEQILQVLMQVLGGAKKGDDTAAVFTLAGRIDNKLASTRKLVAMRCSRF
jgi:hypothetical protein